MALFSRRPKPRDAEATPAAEATSDPASESHPVVTTEQATTAASAEPVPEVGISVSSFDGLGSAHPAPAAPPALSEPEPAPAAPAAPAATARPRPTPADNRPAAAARLPTPAEAPPAETVAGLPENVLLRDAVARFAAEPGPTGLVNVARQLLQGSVYLRVKGDARALLTAGREVPFAVATRDGEQFAVVFSGGRALQSAVQADGAADTSALGQPAQAVLRLVLAGSYAGVVIDSWAGRTSPVLPRTLLQTALDEADPEATVKTLLAGRRTPETASAVVAALSEQRMWIAANRAEGSESWGVAESRSPDGLRHLTVFSHPLEVSALGRGNRPIPITVAQLAGALAADAGLAGILIDPAGPWMSIGRADLAPLLARSEAS